MQPEASLYNDTHVMIFENYVRGIGMTPRMVTNIDTGENYRDGETAARIFGVTRQAVNNCIHGRQETVGGFHLVSAPTFRRGLLKEFTDICHENGTDPQKVIEEFRSL